MDVEKTHLKRMTVIGVEDNMVSLQFAASYSNPLRHCHRHAEENMVNCSFLSYNGSEVSQPVPCDSAECDSEATHGIPDMESIELPVLLFLIHCKKQASLWIKYRKMSTVERTKWLCGPNRAQPVAADSVDVG
jgi:hypothetical protein